MSAGVSFAFSELIAPVSPEEFYARIFDRSAAHFPGAEDRFAHLLTWRDFNQLLNMSKLWSDRTMKLVLEGQDVPPEAFCVTGHTRHGVQAMLPDRAKVGELLARGATLSLDLIDTLTPGISAITAALQTSTGGVVVCNAYCSWNARPGFGSHYDTTDVIVVHIAGTKAWRIYSGRAEQPLGLPGHDFSSLAPEHHERAKGEVAQELDMTPGDVLYLPRGLYHDALASSEACLHLSFGITYATGLDFVGILKRSLSDDPLFRRSLPHFDDQQEHRRHLRQLADQLHDYIVQPEMSEQIRAWQRGRAFREAFWSFALPDERAPRLYRVRSVGVRREIRGNETLLHSAGGETLLDGAEIEVLDWLMARDWFNWSALQERFTEHDSGMLEALLDKLSGAGLVEAL